jgi:drug/metabolite transporter (DMT)-like permease
LAAVGIGIPALYAIILANRLGDISFVAPFRYSRIVFGLLLSLIVFGEVLDRYTLIGAGIIVASGLYTFAREARLRRASQSTQAAL